jgi:Flp pilus assembly pilin Flp
MVARSLDWARARRDAGQGIVEYGLILGLSGLVTLVILVVFGPTLSDVIQFIVGAVNASS